MSLSKETKLPHSKDKAEWVKWPHLETHWPPQHYETQHRAKKSENARSHSWWWDSHISPKSSRWLQDNLAEMDSKVNAMLKIIEEDADSFAKRAEMYYKRRPELLNLVEEFYRTYRALVERHTSLTKDLRHNIAPTLQAHFGAAILESPPNQHLSKHGSDGFDIAGLSSYSYPGAVECDDDNQSEFSVKSGHADEDEPVPVHPNESTETQDFEFKSVITVPEDGLQPCRQPNPSVDVNSSDELKRALQTLKDENKTLAAQTAEDVAKLHDLQMEVSSLHSNMKALETEEKHAKNRIQSLLQGKQTLEAENLKLSHALITCKEEKTHLMEARDQGLLERGEKIQQLEEQVSVLKKEVEMYKAEVQEEKNRGSITLKECAEGLHMQVEGLEVDNEALKALVASATIKIENLEGELARVEALLKDLEGALLDSQQQKEVLERSSSAAAMRIAELQMELEVASRNYEAEKNQMSHLVVQLEADIRDVNRARDSLEAHCKALEANEAQLEEKLIAMSNERNSLQDESVAMEGKLVEAHSVTKDLQQSVAALSSEKVALLQKLSTEVKSWERQSINLTHKADELEGENKKLKLQSAAQAAQVEDLKASLSRVLLEKEVLEGKEVQALQLLSDLKKARKAENAELEQTLNGHATRSVEIESSPIDLQDEKGMLVERVREVLQINNGVMEELTHLKKERIEGSNLVEKLYADVDNLQRTRDGFSGKCQQLQADCEALRLTEQQLKAKVEEFRMDIAGLSSEKQALILELQEASEQIKLASDDYSQMQAMAEEFQAESKKLRQELECELAQAAGLKERMSSLLHEKEVLENSVHNHALVMQGEKEQLEEELKQKLTLIDGLNEKVVDLQRARNLLLLEEEQTCERVSQLQEMADSLSEKYRKSQEDYCKAEEEARTAQAEVVGHLLDIEKLQDDASAAAKLIAVLESETTSMHAKLARSEEEIARVEMDKEHALKMLAEATLSIHGLEVELTAMGKENEILREEMASRQHHGTLLQEELDNCREQATKLAEEKMLFLKKNKDHRKELQVELQTSKDMARHLEAEFEKLHKVVSTAIRTTSIPPSGQEERSVDALPIVPDKFNFIHQKVSSLLEERGLVTKELRAHKEEKSELKMRVSNLLKEKDVLEEQVATLKAQLQVHANMIQTLEGDFKKLQQAVFMLGEGSSASTYHAQERSLDAPAFMSERFKEIHHRVGNLIQEREALTSTISSLKGQRIEMENTILSLKSDKHALQEGLSQALSSVQRFEGDIKDLHMQKEDLARSLDVEVMDGKRQEAELRRMQEALKIERDALRTTVDKLEHDLAHARDEKGTLLSELEATQLEMKGVHENLSAMRSKWEVEQENLQEQLGWSKAAHAEGLKELVVHLETIAKLKGQLSELQGGGKRLEEHVAQLTIRHMDAERSALEAKGELERQIAESEVWKLEMADARSKLRELEQDLADAKEEKKSLLGRMEAMQLGLADAGKDLSTQLDLVGKLNDELNVLRSQTTLLQESRDANARDLSDAEKELAGHQHQLEAALERECKTDKQLLELLAMVDALKHSVETKESENSRLLENLRKLAEDQSLADKKFTAEIASLQSEEERWQGEATTQSATAAELKEKVASLRMENGVLHEDLSLKIELGLKLQKDVELLTEEGTSVSQALEDMVTEMTPLKNDLQFFREVMVPSLEERVVELEGENTKLRVMNQRHVAGIDGLRGQIEAIAIERLHLHEENAVLKVQWIVGDGMLKHAEELLSLVKRENRKLVEDVGLKERQSQMLTQSLAKATKDVKDLRTKLSAAVEERNVLRSEARSMEHKLTENAVKELQAKLMHLQERNDHLHVELGSCKAQIGRLERERSSWKGENTELQQNMAAITLEKKRVEEAIVELKEREKSRRARDESARAEWNELSLALSSFHNEAMKLTGMLQTKLVDALEQVKLMLHGCKDYVGDDEDTMEIVKKLEHHQKTMIFSTTTLAYLHANSSQGDHEGSAIENTDVHGSSNTDNTTSPPYHESGEEIGTGSRSKAMAAKNELFLSELQARAEEAHLLLDIVEFVKKFLARLWSTERTDEVHEPGAVETAIGTDKQTIPIMDEEQMELVVRSVQHHGKLAERLHQAFMDEKLEHELLELKKDRKQLKEELKARLDDVLKMDKEVEELQGMLQASGDGRPGQEGKRQLGDMKASMDRAIELRQILSQQRRQIDRMQEEVIYGEEQQEAAAENQVTVLVSMENAPGMEGWDDEQVDLLSKELESLKALNRRHSAELQMVSQDLQSMGSIIKSAQEQLLLGSPHNRQEELISTADQRTQNSRISVDSTQELLSPTPVTTSGPFPLKPRNFGFTWFLLLFSPDRKASLVKSKSNKPWKPTTLLKPVRRSNSGSTALVGSRRNVAGCFACVPTTSRLDSLDHR